LFQLLLILCKQQLIGENTLETSVKDSKLHSKRVKNLSHGSDDNCTAIVINLKRLYTDVEYQKRTNVNSRAATPAKTRLVDHTRIEWGRLLSIVISFAEGRVTGKQFPPPEETGLEIDARLHSR
jgi:hypothetical protein